MLLFFYQMHIKRQIHLRMGINAFHLVLFFVLIYVNVGFYIWHPTQNSFFQNYSEVPYRQSITSDYKEISIMLLGVFQMC